MRAICHNLRRYTRHKRSLWRIWCAISALEPANEPRNSTNEPAESTIEPGFRRTNPRACFVASGQHRRAFDGLAAVVDAAAGGNGEPGGSQSADRTRCGLTKAQK
jgi:hypothetical protein